jgi:hypothetical protein
MPSSSFEPTITAALSRTVGWAFVRGAAVDRGGEQAEVI